MTNKATSHEITEVVQQLLDSSDLKNYSKAILGTELGYHFNRLTLLYRNGVVMSNNKSTSKLIQMGICYVEDNLVRLNPDIKAKADKEDEAIATLCSNIIKYHRDEPCLCSCSDSQFPDHQHCMVCNQPIEAACDVRHNHCSSCLPKARK